MPYLRRPRRTSLSVAAAKQRRPWACSKARLALRRSGSAPEIIKSGPLGINTA
jgi:hypothetical protein